jgi:hypothetical protein
MEPGGSLPCSQQPATDPYPEPDESSLHSHNLFLEDILSFLFLFFQLTDGLTDKLHGAKSFKT